MPEIKNPEDIKTLPWLGNYAADAWLFDLIEEFIMKEPDLHRRQLADQLASEYGMGIECEIDPSYDPADR
jgi:hypothetical protein